MCILSCSFYFLSSQDICSVAAVNIEATSKRIEQAVGDMLDVLETNYEKIKEGSKPLLKPDETESRELVCNHTILYDLF